MGEAIVDVAEFKARGKVLQASFTECLDINIFDDLNGSIPPPLVDKLFFVFNQSSIDFVAQFPDGVEKNVLLVCGQSLPGAFVDQNLQRRLDMACLLYTSDAADE